MGGGMGPCLYNRLGVFLKPAVLSRSERRYYLLPTLCFQLRLATWFLFIPSRFRTISRMC
jgi:hypothetical protein